MSSKLNSNVTWLEYSAGSLRRLFRGRRVRRFSQTVPRWQFILGAGLLAATLPGADCRAMCLFERDPVELTLKIEECSPQVLSAGILSGLGSEAKHWQGTQKFRYSSETYKEGFPCNDFPPGKTITAIVRRDCCDTPGSVCFFGWVESAAMTENRK